jgi:hypothetical protein
MYRHLLDRPGRLSALCLGIGLAASLLMACGNGTGTPVSDDEEHLFWDDFSGSQAAPWKLEADDVAATTIQDGRLVITVNQPNTLQYSGLSEPLLDDFVLEVEATQLAGSPESSFGVLFRLQSQGEFYRFDITGDGRYTVERHNLDGSWTRFTDGWTRDDALQSGLNTTNRLRVVAEGFQLSLYANGELLQTFSDSAYPVGTIALDAGTFGKVPLSVAFDNVQIDSP